MYVCVVVTAMILETITTVLDNNDFCDGDDNEVDAIAQAKSVYISDIEGLAHAILTALCERWPN